MNEYELIKNSPFFDRDFYIKEYKDVALAHIDPIWHYLHLGWKERRKPSHFLFLTSSKSISKVNIQEILIPLFFKTRKTMIHMS